MGAALTPPSMPSLPRDIARGVIRWVGTTRTRLNQRIAR
jgi:hypothetical protein